MSKKYAGTKKNIVLSYVNLSVNMLTGFFILPFIVSSLGSADYGLMQLVYSITGYVGILDLGLGNAVTRFTAMYNTEEKHKKINTVATYSLLIYSVMAVLGLLIGLIVYYNFGNLFNLTANEVSVGKIIFMIGFTNSLLHLPAMTFSAVIRGFNRYDYFYLTRIIKTILRIIAIIVMFKLGYGLITLFIIDFVLNQTLHLFWFAFNIQKLNLRFTLGELDKEFKKEFGVYSFYVFLGVITDQIYWRTDNILLGIFTSTEEIAVYSISQKIVGYFKSIATTFTGAFLPKLTNMVFKERSNSKILGFFTKASKYQFVIVLVILTNFILLGREFIFLWVGNNYIKAYYYSLIIMIPFTIPLFQTTGFRILYAQNKHKVRSIVFLFNAIINIIVSVFLINKIGVIGAAIGTGLALFLGNTLFMNYYYKKELGLKILNFFKTVCLKTFLAIIPTILILLSSYSLYPNYSFQNFMFRGIFSNVPFLFILYFFVFNEKEKEDLKSLKNNIKK